MKKKYYSITKEGIKELINRLETINYVLKELKRCKKMQDPLKIEEYGRKSFVLKIPKILKRKKGFLPLFISKGCFSKQKNLLQ